MWRLPFGANYARLDELSFYERCCSAWACTQSQGPSGARGDFLVNGQAFGRMFQRRERCQSGLYLELRSVRRAARPGCRSRNSTCLQQEDKGRVTLVWQDYTAMITTHRRSNKSSAPFTHQLQLIQSTLHMSEHLLPTLTCSALGTAKCQLQICAIILK